MFRQFTVFILLALLLAACTTASQPTEMPVSIPTEAPATQAPSEETAPALVFTDSLGRNVTLEMPAQRVVSIAPSLTEVLYAVGAGDQMVGRDEYSDYPEAAMSVASIGSVYGTLNTEAILALSPDLVVAADINSPEHIKALEDLDLTVYCFDNPTSLEGVYEHLRIMGQLTGHESEAEELIASLQQRVETVRVAVAPVTEKPTVFYEIDGTDPSKPWTSGPGTFMDALITEAGGINIGAALSDPFAQISIEEIVVQDPDFIILGDAEWGITAESIGMRTGWTDLTAVREGKIFPFASSLSSRPGPRLVDGLEALLTILHPELSPKP